METLSPITGKKTSVSKKSFPALVIQPSPGRTKNSLSGQGHSGTLVEGGDFKDRLTLWLFEAPEVGSGLPQSWKQSPESKLTLPNAFLLPTGQLPPGSRSPGAPFLWLFPRKTPARPAQETVSTQWGLGRLQLSHSRILLWEKEGTSTSWFLKKAGCASGTSCWEVPSHPGRY